MGFSLASVGSKLLLARLNNIGLSGCQLVRKYLIDRTQYIYAENYKSSLLEIFRGVPPGSILAPLKKVSSYKYLGIWLDKKLYYKVQIDNLMKKLKLKYIYIYIYCNSL